MREAQEVGQTIPERQVVQYLLRGLSESYDSVKTALKVLAGGLDLTSSLSRVEPFEAQFEAKVHRTGSGMAAFGRGDPRGRGRYQSAGGRGTCFVCGDSGHSKDRCPRWNKFLALEKAGARESSGSALVAGGDTKGAVWYLESGASSHMTGDSTSFVDFQVNTAPHFIEVGDGVRLYVKGKGTIIYNAAGCHGVFDLTVTLTDVYFVDGLAKNLVSVSALVKKGIRPYIDDDGGYVIPLSLSSSVWAPLCNGIYPIAWTPVDQYTSGSAFAALSADLWHQRFSHISPSCLARMVREGMVVGVGVSSAEFLRAGEEHVCAACVMGKRARAPFKAVTLKASVPMETLAC
jgi:hypothetical protein